MEHLQKISLFVAFFMLQTNLVQAQLSFGQSELINDQWQFYLGDDPKASFTGYDASKWQNIDLPHDWSVKQQLSPTLASCTGYLPGGIAWYRKDLKAPAGLNGKKLYVYFEGVYNHSKVYINGHLLGERPNGYVSFMYELTPYLNFGGENILAVRVDHSEDADSRWYTGSGIYRNVWLVEANPVHIAQWGVYAYPSSVAKNQAVLSGEIEIENGTPDAANLTVQNELLASDGRIAGKSSKKVLVPANGKAKVPVELKVKNPQIWDLNSPNLYTLETTILQNGKVIDKTTTTTGFRTLAFDPNKGFALNGERMKIKGVCLHHDAGVLGAAVPREVWKRRLLALKETGVNAIRTSHNPQAPDLYELCDELGLLVLNEAADEWEYPKRKWLEGWNVGTPGFQGNFSFFKEWAEKDLADMVRRDRNHISIFAWSIVNEVDYPNDPYSHPILDGGVDGFTQAMFGGYKKDAPNAERLDDIAKRMVAVVKEYDKSRPVTAGLAGVAMSNETEFPFALDITGYNYTESRYISDHIKYPDRVIYGSENRHDLAAWKAVADNEHIFGQFLWTGIDYLGESGRWPSRGFYSGLLDFGGFIKPRGYFRQSLWSDIPMAYLGTYPTPRRGGRSQMQDVWSQSDSEKESNYRERTPSMDAWSVWNYREGQSVRVVCYTNTAKAQLLLNGNVAGQTKEYDDNTGIIYWDIPYQPGKLEVIGMDKDGGEQARYVIQSSGRPHSITVTSDKTILNADKDLAHVVIQIVDENGVPVMLSDDEVTCHISGPAKLLGLEASNNSDMSDYTDNRHRVFNGRILAYIQTTGEAGDVKVRVTAPWLQSGEVDLSVK